jgi:hypothetical protein
MLDAGRARGQALVVPNANAAAEGNTNNIRPFVSATGSNGGLRYQQVYSASQFGAFAGAPRQITQIAFRNDGTFGQPFAVTLPSANVHLSTTTQAPDALSTTFAANVGPDDTAVYDAALPLASSNTGSPRNFDIVITLTTPFTYNPSTGNLLLDIRLTNTTSVATAFDAQNIAGDSTSRVMGVEGDVNATSGLAESVGLVTRFTHVPEPSATAVCFCAAGLGAGVLRRRRRKADAPVAG